MTEPFLQNNFSGGMNLFDDDINLSLNEYGVAFNVRNRRTFLSGVKGPTEITDLPGGKKQGIYAFDNFILVFVNGSAYYKNVVTDAAWTRIDDYIADPMADYVYAEAVPASDANFERILLDATQIEGTVTDQAVTRTNKTINGTPACLVCGTGTSDEMLIFPDGTARKANTYDQWNKATDREYVPRMKQRKFVNGILFGVHPDGRRILRSVSGRPIDFVVNVKADGDKGGNAETTAYSVGYDQITCLTSINSQKLLVGTSTRCFPLGLNYDKTIFAEPTFINIESFQAGITNQHSFLNVLRLDGYSDYFFVDTDGMRSLNATLQDQNEGRNSDFSSKIINALAQKQDVTAAIQFDNHSFFAIKTTYGYVVAVFDNLRQKWVCFDNYEIGAIKQFAIASQSTAPKIYAITEDKVYELFSGDYLTSTLNPRATTNASPRNLLKLSDVYCVFGGSTVEADVEVTEIVDETERDTVTQQTSTDSIDPLRFNFQGKSKIGWKIVPKVSWSDGSNLKILEATFENDTSQTPIKQRQARYA